MYRIVLSWIVILLGIAFAAGGAYLISLGGSWYYAVTGMALTISGWLLFSRKQPGLAVYGVVVGYPRLEPMGGWLRLVGAIRARDFAHRHRRAAVAAAHGALPAFS